MLEWLIAKLGLLGLFLASAIANTILPIPFELVLPLVYKTNYSLAVWLLVASLGAVVGESTIYWAAARSRGALKRFSNWIMKKLGKRELDLEKIVGDQSNLWLKDWFDSWGFGAIFIGAFTPLPMFLFDIFAGYLGYPYWLFALACFLGKLARYSAVLLGGTAFFGLLLGH